MSDNKEQNITTRVAAHIDLLAAIGAVLWAVLITAEIEAVSVTLEAIISREAAGTFAALAFARWLGRMRVLAGIATAVLLGCTAIPIRPVAPEDVELVELAAHDLGYSVRWTERGMQLELLDERPAEHAGKAWRGVCARRAESIRDTSVLRHEIGHLLGLDHVPDPGNVMHAIVGRDTTALTHEQRKVMRAELAFLEACVAAMEYER